MGTEHAAIMTLNYSYCAHIPLCSLEIRVGQDNEVVSSLDQVDTAVVGGAVIQIQTPVSVGPVNPLYG